ncbi:PAS domain S-box protein [Salinibacter ruber]|uniref:PAS domain S-box protein n=1 Tax=Salinibacter ruber TaxID=146919 RepID=UPI002168DBE7|nr:PAS domain S-box protein [Salinibacter ruber]MCS3698663.1 PAS domain S-box-containing protein [Salinibacter ruber]
MDALPTGDLAYLVYLLVFAVAAAGCLAGAWQAHRRVSLPGVRRGLAGLLSASGLWALCHVGVLLSPGLGLKVAFYEAGLTVGFGTVFAWLWLCSAYSGRALHRRAGVRWAALAIFAAVTLTKLTNQWHGLYFGAEMSVGPFPHLAVDHHVIYWLTAGLSYALAVVGFFMLAEPLRRAQVGGKKLAGLFGLTALPLGANAIGYATPYLVDLSHEPVGVAAFALGALALRERRLEETSRAGREERPSLVLSADGRIRNYNQAAAELIPALRGGTSRRETSPEGTPQEGIPQEGTPQEEEIAGRHLEEALPWLARALNGESPGTEPSGAEPSGAEPSGAELSGKNPSGKELEGKKGPEDNKGPEENEELRENGRRSEEKFSAEKPSAEEKLLEMPAGGGEARYYRPVESQAGPGAGRLVVLQDVTEQVLRRRERASRLEALFNQSPDMINVHDAEGRILEANPRFFEKTGHEEEDLQGMKVWDLDRSISREEALELWAGMEPGDRRRLEGTYRRKDGSAFPVEVDIRRLRLEGKGQFMAISRDITDRKVAGRKLRQERDRLGTLFESLPSPVVRCWAEGGRATVEEANPAFAETFPVGQEEAEGQDLNDLLVPAGQKDAAAEIDRRAVEEGPVEHEVRRVAAGGEVRDFQLQVAGRRPEEGPPEIYAIYTDITDRKRRERRRQRAEALFQNAQDALFIVDVESGEASDGGASGSRDGAAREQGGAPGEGGLSFSVRRVNPAFEGKTGLESEDLRGKDPKEVFGAEVGAEIEEKYRECIRREEPMEYEEEVPIGGETTYWTTRIAPVAASGETQMIIGTARNVTEDRRREETLRRQKSLLERTQKLAGAWEADLQAGEVNWSDRIYEIHEMEPGAEIDLEKGLSFYAPESRERLLEATETLVEEGRPYDLELQIETAEGNRRWIRVAGAPAESSGGPVEGEITKVAGALQDITERKEEKRRRKQVISRVTDGILKVNSEWRVTLVNEQAEAAYGMSEEKMLGRSLWDVFGGLEGTRFEEVYREVMRFREPAEIEEHYSGMGEWFDVQVYPNGDGGLDFYFRVITERKEREEALREAKRRYQTLIENFPDGGAYLFDEDLRYVLAGGEKIGVVGGPEEVIGSTVREVLPEEIAERQARCFRRALEGRRDEYEEMYRGRYYRVQALPVRGQDGEVTSGVAFAQDITEQNRRKEELKQRKEELRRKKEELKRKKEELKRKNDLFERAQEIASVGAWEHDLQAGENRWTSEVYRIYGYEDASGPVPPVENGVEFYHPEDRPAVRSAFEKAVEEGRSFDIEARLITEDGEEKWVRARGEPQWEDGSPDQEDGNSEGEVARVRGTLQDITDRKEREEALRAAKEETERSRKEAEEARQESEEARQEAEEAKEEAEEARREAEEASRLKSALLANMSHEIRTPLTSIIGFAEMLGREAAGLELPGDSPLPGYASTIEQSGKRLLETLNGVLNLSKLQAGQMEMEAGPTCLPEQARLAAEELRPEAEEKRIGLELETGGGPAAVAEADEGGVQIVLRNLLSNAIKYTDEGGVTVRTYREDGDQEDGHPQEDGWAVLEVEDTGIGMDPEVAEGLFEPFRQASEGISREYEGTGIGLAVTREAVAQMGGSVEVDTQKGQGTCMTVRLPLAGEAGAA